MVVGSVMELNLEMWMGGELEMKVEVEIGGAGGVQVWCGVVCGVGVGEGHTVDYPVCHPSVDLCGSKARTSQ